MRKIVRVMYTVHLQCRLTFAKRGRGKRKGLKFFEGEEGGEVGGFGGCERRRNRIPLD